MTRMVFPLWALVAWALTAILVAQLLGGTFDVRACHSGCVWLLYWAVFVVTIAGCITGIGWFLKSASDKPLLSVISIAALLFLQVIFFVTMAIGEWG